MTTTVVNIRDGSDYDVLIARPGPWGNPFAIGPQCSREQAIIKYEMHMRRRPDLLAKLPELVDKRLGCYCAPLPCHGHVLLGLMQKQGLIERPPESRLKLILGPSLILEKPCQSDLHLPKWIIPAMFALLREHRGLGLAAPQVGINARLFVTSWGVVYVNPIITWHGKCRAQTIESCLSFPGALIPVTRYCEIEMDGQRYKGVEAIVLQHELDHLNGRHITMKGVE